MSRRRAAVRRKIIPDVKYNSVILAKFINCLMTCGKRSVAEKGVYDALILLEKRAKKNALEAFEAALDNVKPLLEVRSRRVGGATYQVPVEVREDRRVALAFRWLITAARKRRAEKTIATRLAAELLDAFNNRGTAVKKREDTHKMAEANRAFSHYRW
jgi:small subunit ribosomal protein S7